MASSLTFSSIESGAPSKGWVARLLWWGLHLRLWVALAVGSLAAFVELASGSVANLASANGTLAVVFFSTLTLYNLDGRIDEGEKLSPSTARRRAHLILSLSSLAALVWCASSLSTIAQVLTAFGVGLSSLYVLPSSWGSSRGGIKMLAGIKSPFVGVAVSTAVVWLPFLGSGAPFFSPIFLVLWITLALYCTANALLFDVVDHREDAARQVPTVAVHRGIHTAKRRALGLASAGFLVAPLLVLSVGGAALLSKEVSNLLALAGLGLFLLVAAWRVDEQSSRDHIAWLVDGGLFIPLVVRLLWFAFSSQNT